jgi:glycerate-2-kinase
VRFKNEGELLKNAASDTLKRLRRDAMDILRTAVDAVDPVEAVRRKLRVEGDRLGCGDVQLDLDRFFRISVIGGGKAGGAMAEAVEGLLRDRISGGVVNVPRGTESIYKLKKIQLNGASHPVPDEDGLKGVEKMLSLLDGAREDDLFIVLISGGGSALMTYPAEGLGLGEIQRMTDLLLKSGATINELNAVRKHLSAVKGGHMARRAHPATVLSLILSDVVGDPLDTIASGPTAPDSTTFRDAVKILKGKGLWEKTPEPIRHHLEEGLKGEREETPKPGSQLFRRVHNRVVGSNLTAATAALARASALRYNSLLLTTRMEGEASQVGTAIAGVASEIEATGNPLPPPAAVIIGGETTVTVTGQGLGGRNQELALSTARKIQGLNLVIAALATDGVDGPTEAAGAIVDGSTMHRARSLGLEPGESLADNDSYRFFKELGDCFMTGPTGTNVNDLTLILVSG